MAMFNSYVSLPDGLPFNGILTGYEWDMNGQWDWDDFVGDSW